MILKKLQELGFSEKEARIYIELVQLGPQPVSVIARRAQINRTTAYDILESLSKKGLIRSTKKKSATYFEALHPKQLKNYLEREKNETIRKIEKQQATIDEMLPILISLENPQSTKPKVTFYEGEKGMREAYEDTLNAKEEILAYANVEEMHKGLPNFFPDYYQRRGVEKNIHIKWIGPDNQASIHRATKDHQENRESVLISKDDYGFTPEINIYNNKVLFASWIEKMAVVIESKEIADFHRKMYQLCWDRGKAIDVRKDGID